MITHNRFYTEAMVFFGGLPIKTEGSWVAYKNREVKEFNQQAAALCFSQFVEFIDGETKEAFFERQKQWQHNVNEFYLNLLAKEYPNVSMEKIKEVTSSFLNDEDHLKILDIVSDAIEQAKEKESYFKINDVHLKINDIDNLKAGDLVVVWDDEFATMGDNCPYYIRNFKGGNEETGEFDTWFMNTEDFDDFDSWKYCVKFEYFKQLLDENKI